MHAKLDTSKYKGLKPSNLKALKKILNLSLSPNEIINIDLANALANLAHELNLNLSIVVNRRGKLVNLTVGEPFEVIIPEINRQTSDINNLCGYRIIYTINHNQLKTGNVKNNDSDEIKIKRENLLTLVKNRLDLLVQIEINPEATFSKKFGQHGIIADRVNYVHLLPNRDLLGNLWKISPSYTVRQCQKQNFEDLIQALEEEFVKYQPKSFSGPRKC